MSPDHLSSTFAALADPTRRALRNDRSCRHQAPQGAAARRANHTQSRQAQWRPCRLEAKPLQEVSDWVVQYRQFWEQSFDRLDEYLQDVQAKEKKRGRKKKQSY